jgi:glutaminyl-peptide cyclotransferase
MRMLLPVATLTIALASVLACGEDAARPTPPAPTPVDTSIVTYTYHVVNSYPHDTGAFTEGLVWDDSVLIEGTGYFNGESSVRRVRLETGDVLQKRAAPFNGTRPVFGEGVVRVGDRLVELTWTDHIAWIYDAASFDSIGQFTYPTEGWGLTRDATRFIMSDGTSTLYFRDFDTFAEIGRVTVRDEHGPVLNINELEFIDGMVYANVFETGWVVIIDPATGRVRGRVDLSGLLANPPDVLNGIAYDAANDRLFVTGKRWPTLFEITLTPVASASPAR